MRIPSLLKHRSVQVVIAIAIYLLAASSLPLVIHQGLYTFSLLIIDLLLWLLPITVGLFIAPTIASFEKRAPLFILSLFLFEALSNAMSVWYAYGCGHLALSSLPSIEPHSFNGVLDPFWRLAALKPAWWTAGKGVFLGIAIGLLAAFKFPLLRDVLLRGKKNAEWVLTSLFSPLIPFFVLGFVARIYKTRLLENTFSYYADLILWLLLVLAAYISLLFFLGKSRLGFLKSIKNILPAASLALSSSCSLSTMPWTIEGTSKNLQDPDLAKTIIPATTNIQQIGDCIANSFLCFLIYSHFNGHSPSLLVWIPFSAVFVLARFATAAVIGGAIFIMLPIYESYLGFTPEMIAIILAFNEILDPLITSTNVVANSALCRIFERVWLSILGRPVPVK